MQWYELGQPILFFWKVHFCVEVNEFLFEILTFSFCKATNTLTKRHQNKKIREVNNVDFQENEYLVLVQA